MGKKRQIKPSQYPGEMLKALAKDYDDENNPQARGEGTGFLEILQLTGMTTKYAAGDISTQEIYDYLRQLRQGSYIYESGRANGQPLYKPTPEGLQRGRFLNRSWRYRNVIHPIWAHVAEAVVTLLMTLLALYLAWIFGWR